MSESAPLAFHIDSPADWRPLQPAAEIRGWLFTGKDTPCLDLRARVDDRVTLGNYGLDRPDAAQALGIGTNCRIGFVQTATFWRGARRVALDFHDGRQWREFFAHNLDTSALPESARKPRRILRAVMVGQTLAYLYRHFHRASWRDLCREADRVLAGVLTPAGEWTSPDAFIGAIENPGHWVNAGYGKFRITGWIFGVGRNITQLSATTGVLTENRLVYPKDRPDVAAHRSDHANALQSGYYGLVDLGDNPPSPVNLKLFAETGDGTRQLAQTRRLHLDRRDEHTGPVPVYRRVYFWKVAAAFFRSALWGHFTADNWREVRGELKKLRVSLSGNLSHGEAPKLPAAIVRRRDQDPYTRWRHHNRLTPRLRAALQADAAALVQSGGPLISVVVPAYNTPERYLRELLDSLAVQLYPRWELCIADDASPQPHVRRQLESAAHQDPRIRPLFRTENGHISAATNSALDAARGAYVALLDHDDLLTPDALLHVAQAIARRPTAGYLYTDEDKIDDHGRHFDPQLKGGWNPEMALTHNYTHHLTVIRLDLVRRAGGMRPAFSGAQDLDLFLRCWEQLEPADIVHIPHLGYHWRAHAESTATRGDQKGYLFAAARNAIAEALQRRGLRATPELPPIARDYALCLHQLQWDPAILRENPVTIVIPTRNRADLLAPCLDSIARTTPRESVHVVVVDDHSDDPATLELLAALPGRTDLSAEVVRADGPDTGFNYSRLVNLGSARARTPLLLHLNNDVEALAHGWLEDLAGWLSVPGVGVAGAKLLYPDGSLNHAGIGLSPDDGLPHVQFDREPADALGTLFLPHCARDVVAVTGACLLTRTALYRELGGFDETALQVAYNDVDYCIRALARGQRTVFSPQAVLRHHGSATRGRTYTEREHVAYLERHGSFRDPYISGSLSFPPRNLPLNPWHQRSAHTPRPFRVLVLTHNLKFEGAPIFIFELARYLAAQPGLSVTVASPEAGPLSARYAELRIPVEIWDAASLAQAATPEAFQRALKAFAAARAWDDADVFVCNTMLTFWGVHLAAHLGKTSALYVHESNAIPRFFQPLLPPPMHAVVAEAFRLATRVVFTAAATRGIFEELNVNDNFRTLRSWVDFDRIEAFKSSHDKAALRRRHGLDPDAALIVNIGSVCERKGQHIFIRGIDLLNRAAPPPFAGRNLQWALVGAREGLYMETLREDITLLGLHDVKIFPETGAIYDFYRMADLLVCTSFEESFPRVLLEAMVFGDRIVSTDVNGIAEMLTNTDEAWLVPAGDPFKLAAALQNALAAHFAGDTRMPSLAYARAARDYHHRRALPRHLEVIREAWLG